MISVPNQLHFLFRKSTFIKVLAGQQEVDSGDVELGETVVFGIYDQMGIEIDGNKRVLDFMKERVEARDGSSMAEAPQEAMKLLKRFQFDRNRWNEVSANKVSRFDSISRCDSSILIPLCLRFEREYPCFLGERGVDCSLCRFLRKDQTS